ncbi:hypothetical protein BDA99DRAFT_540477 [Phascolomyces articulosus]|uniref:F-box domain-containing protein n=1 Tax=Phascolomyces articulosus TaxID=60185 RepID=A0AAD5JTN5_9FUNG|nr:hypothetical protein BDA99DRAFT_540477 [Phascolomyces articulosus]
MLKHHTSSAFPVYTLNVNETKNYFLKVGEAIDKHDYDTAIKFATNTIDNINQSLLVSVLNHRAYAFAMNGQFDKGIKDAKQMISIAPTLPLCHERFGFLYAMSGRQQKAIVAYEAALKRIELQEKINDSQKAQEHSHHEPIVNEKALATQRDNSRIDFLMALPTELSYYIISDLGDDDKDLVECILVSRKWRELIVGCPIVWMCLSIDDSDVGDILPILPNIAPFVQDLMVTKNNRFKILKVLELEAITLRNIHPNSIQLLESSFLWQVRATLTKLELHFGEGEIVFKLSDLLYIFPYLTILIYTTTKPLSNIGIEEKPISENHPLEDLQLRAQSISRQVICPLLQKCQEIRRLVLDGCWDNDILHDINARCLNLEVLGYNPYSNVTQLKRQNNKGDIVGICEFYTLEGGDRYGISPNDLLPIIQKNMKRLEVLVAAFSISESQQAGYIPIVEHLGQEYNDLWLPNLRELTFWSDPKGLMESLFLRSISGCKSLEILDVTYACHTSAIVDTLRILPPLKRLELKQSQDEAGDTDLKQLFKYYAEASTNTVSTVPTLEYIHLDDCKGVTNEVLANLGDIPTLTKAMFYGHSRVSEKGIQCFFKKLTKITDFVLGSLDNVTDNTIMALGDLPCLQALALENLPHISDRGIISLIDKTVNLKRLDLMQCTTITGFAIEYAKRKNVIVKIEH